MRSPAPYPIKKRGSVLGTIYETCTVFNECDIHNSTKLMFFKVVRVCFSFPLLRTTRILNIFVHFFRPSFELPSDLGIMLYQRQQKADGQYPSLLLRVKLWIMCHYIMHVFGDTNTKYLSNISSTIPG